MKISPSLPSHSLPVRAETPDTMVLVIRRLAWSEALAVLVWRASWRRRLCLLIGALKIPMPLIAPLCGAQRRVVGFLSFLASFFYPLFQYHALAFPTPIRYLQTGSFAWSRKSSIWNQFLSWWPESLWMAIKESQIHSLKKEGEEEDGWQNGEGLSGNELSRGCSYMKGLADLWRAWLLSFVEKWMIFYLTPNLQLWLLK